MNANLEQLINRIPCQFKRRDSVNDQLQDLKQIALRLGMFEAAQLLKQQIALNKHVAANLTAIDQAVKS